jgi:hypothetical protein
MGDLVSVDLNLQKQRVSRSDQLAIDFLKGSYYANPTVDNPIASAEDRVAYPEYYGQNICKLLLLTTH